MIWYNQSSLPLSVVAPTNHPRQPVTAMSPTKQRIRPQLKRFNGLSWNAVLAIVSVVFVIQLALLALVLWLPGRSNIWVAVGLIGLAGTLAAWLALGWFAAGESSGRRTADAISLPMSCTARSWRCVSANLA